MAERPELAKYPRVIWRSDDSIYRLVQTGPDAVVAECRVRRPGCRRRRWEPLGYETRHQANWLPQLLKHYVTLLEASGALECCRWPTAGK